MLLNGVYMPSDMGEKKTKKLLKHVSPRKNASKELSGASTEFLIPKKIFQTWESREVSDGMYNAVQSWIEKNPDWEYHFFDDDDLREFIKEHFPKKVLMAYDSLNPGAYKADLWRLCVLYIHGGVYADIKSILLMSLNEIIPKDASFIVCKDKSFRYQEFDGYIYNAFICTKPKHPFIKKIIDKLIANVEVEYYGNDQLSPTGPGAFGKGLNIALNREETNDVSLGQFNFKNDTYYIWQADFKKTFLKDCDGKAFLKTSYPGYKDEKRSTILSKDVINSEYAFCWFLGKVYKDSKKRVELKSQYYSNNKSYFVLKLVLTLCKNKCWKEAFCTLIKGFKSKKITFGGLFKLVLEVLSFGKI
jgi:hypothetical protein